MNTHPDLVFSYSRSQAIADGVLLDVTDLAREAGFWYPVALTAGVWADCVAWPNGSDGRGQDENGRLWDVLSMARLAIKQAEGSEVRFSVLVVPKFCASSEPVLKSLKMMVGPGDALEPVLTILLPGED